MDPIYFQKAVQWITREKYQDKLAKGLEMDIQRLKQGEPVDYIIGFSEFLGCKIDLSFRPLIPRPETEHWVAEAISTLKEKNSSLCLDLFAGSGCIGLAILKNIPGAIVHFADVEPLTLKQIKKNLRINNIKEKRFRIFNSNLFSRIRDQYDCILANPPYVSREVSLSSSVEHFEPSKALRAGKDGLKYIRPLLFQAKTFLRKDGFLYMEFGAGQKTVIGQIARKVGWSRRSFKKDQYGIWRYLILEKREDIMGT